MLNDFLPVGSLPPVPFSPCSHCPPLPLSSCALLPPVPILFLCISSVSLATPSLPRGSAAGLQPRCPSCAPRPLPPPLRKMPQPQPQLLRPRSSKGKVGNWQQRPVGGTGRSAHRGRQRSQWQIHVGMHRGAAGGAATVVAMGLVARASKGKGRGTVFRALKGASFYSRIRTRTSPLPPVRFLIFTTTTLWYACLPLTPLLCGTPLTL